MKRWIAVFLVLLMLGGTCLLPVQAQRLSADPPAKTPAMIGHRGYSEKYPENTALAIEKATEAKRCAALGVDFMETDVFPVFPADA